MRDRYAYDMSEVVAKFDAKARYASRQKSQCREKQKYKLSKLSARTSKRSARRQRESIEDKWREYIETPINANY